VEHRWLLSVTFAGKHSEVIAMNKVFTAIAASALLMLGSAAASAQGASDQAPGQKMQDKGSVSGSPGASGYAPGQRMQDKGSVKGTTGASGYAPGHNATTGSGHKPDEKKR
jgi:hypothetical protein